MAEKELSKDMIRREAQLCKTLKEFRTRRKGCYQTALKHGYLDEVCAHMNTGWNRLNFKEAAKVAAKYKTRAEFAEKDIYEYNDAKERGWLDEVCAHMDTPKVIRSEYADIEVPVYTPDKTRKQYPVRQSKYERWTFEKVAKIAAKYQTRGEFIKKDSNAYRRARERGWLDEACKHMAVKRKR